MFSWLAKAHLRRSSSSKRRLKQSYLDWPVEQLFEDYGIELYGHPKMGLEAAQKIHKHKEFLLESMLCGKGDVVWADTPLYTYLTKKFPKQTKAAKSFLQTMQDNNMLCNALPIRASDSALKRKRGQNVAAEHAELHQDRPVEAKRTATRKHMSENASLPAREEHPSTPKPNSVLDRRRHAMKGRSALRPSAVNLANGGARREEEQAPVVAEDATESEDADTDSSGASDEIDISLLTTRHPGPAPAQVTRDETSSASSGDETGPQGQASAVDVPPSSPARPSDEEVDTWQCTFDGCSHRVVAASQPDLQVLTEEHVALHAYDNDVRVRLVRQLEHASLPVSHLMDRVRLQARADQWKSSRAT